MYIGDFVEFLGHIADAVHRNDEDSTGMFKDLLPPPDAWRITNRKRESLFIGFLNTDLISSIISSSDNADVR